ncbi:hypothetical protein J0X14_12060 [Muricauda sp. CAU 1633]|uniref:hypothetical protein n=1 Tax=Allomuricauda sp. CAU 1633 TaxID=2816036 RepID=UPI001A90C86A|nr:hypothetical protein [Muricauda sp. CAU 1633]MBO0323033.1 hypothetical protein [Muricauda sp. CAU 1633]
MKKSLDEIEPFFKAIEQGISLLETKLRIESICGQNFENYELLKYDLEARINDKKSLLELDYPQGWEKSYYEERNKRIEEIQKIEKYLNEVENTDPTDTIRILKSRWPESALDKKNYEIDIAVLTLTASLDIINLLIESFNPKLPISPSQTVLIGSYFLSGKVDKLRSMPKPTSWRNIAKELKFPETWNGKLSTTYKIYNEIGQTKDDNNNVFRNIKDREAISRYCMDNDIDIICSKYLN